MDIVFYDLDCLAQYAVDIQCLGYAVAVFFNAAALLLLVGEYRHEQPAEAGYQAEQNDGKEQKRLDVRVSEVAADLFKQSVYLLKKQRGNADAYDR